MIGPATILQFLAFMTGAGSVGGLVSGEATRRLEARENRKKQLRRLVADLLELRYRFITMRQAASATAAQIPGHEDTVTVALPATFDWLMNSGNLDERYESAVSELAALDPILAYGLRSKNLAVSALGPLCKAALQNPTGISYVAKALKIFGDIGSSALDDAIRRVAKELDRKERRELQRLLEGRQEMPGPVDQIFALIPQVIQAERQTQPKVDSANLTAPETPGEAQAAKGSG